MLLYHIQFAETVYSRPWTGCLAVFSRRLGEEVNQHTARQRYIFFVSIMNLVFCCNFTCIFFFFLSFAEEMHKFISDQLNNSSRVPLCINPQSAAFKSFARWAASDTGCFYSICRCRLPRYCLKVKWNKFSFCRQQLPMLANSVGSVENI